MVLTKPSEQNVTQGSRWTRDGIFFAAECWQKWKKNMTMTMGGGHYTMRKRNITSFGIFLLPLHELLHHKTEKEKKSQGATLTFGSGFMINSSNICYRLWHSSFYCPFRVCPQFAEFFPIRMKNCCRRHWEDSTGHEYKCSILCESIGLFFSLLCSTLLIQIHTHTTISSVRMYSWKTQYNREECCCY